MVTKTSEEQEKYLADSKPFLSAALYNVLSYVIKNPCGDVKKISRGTTIAQPGLYLKTLKEAKLVDTIKDSGTGRGKPPSLYFATFKTLKHKVRLQPDQTPVREPHFRNKTTDSKVLVRRLKECMAEDFSLWDLPEIQEIVTQLEELV